MRVGVRDLSQGLDALWCLEKGQGKGPGKTGGFVDLRVQGDHAKPMLQDLAGIDISPRHTKDSLLSEKAVGWSVKWGVLSQTVTLRLSHQPYFVGQPQILPS